MSKPEMQIKAYLNGNIEDFDKNKLGFCCLKRIDNKQNPNYPDFKGTIIIKEIGTIKIALWFNDKARNGRDK